jgi:hypothetical protein
MKDEQTKPGMILDRRAFHRVLLLWIHAAIAIILAFTYASKLSLVHAPMGRSGGVTVLLMVAPAWVPYAISAVYTSKVVAFSRIRLSIFIGVLAIGATAQELIGLRMLRVAAEVPIGLLSLIILPAAYVTTAGFFMQTEDPACD